MRVGTFFIFLLGLTLTVFAVLCPLGMQWITHNGPVWMLTKYADGEIGIGVGTCFSGFLLMFLLAAGAIRLVLIAEDRWDKERNFR